MQNQITFSPLSIADLAKEGKTLARIWKQTNNVKTCISDKGFDLRLGKVMAQLRAESPSDQGIVGRDQKIRVGISTIDRRRLNEALKVFDNIVELREFCKSSKKGFTNITALLKAWKKSTEVPSEVEGSKETSKESNVGQSEAKVKPEVKTDQISLGSSKESVMQALKLWADVHNKSVLDIADWMLEVAEGKDPVDDFQETILVKTDLEGIKKVQVKNITNEELPF
jgi:hypothetical protein|tara:strand:- start:1084 stop:1761 length:678 start_codon:yes stop_codon:yes gene_type:complete